MCNKTQPQISEIKDVALNKNQKKNTFKLRNKKLHIRTERQINVNLTYTMLL